MKYESPASFGSKIVANVKGNRYGVQVHNVKFLAKMENLHQIYQKELTCREQWWPSD